MLMGSFPILGLLYHYLSIQTVPHWCVTGWGEGGLHSVRDNGYFKNLQLFELFGYGSNSHQSL